MSSKVQKKYNIIFLCLLSCSFSLSFYRSKRGEIKKKQQTKLQIRSRFLQSTTVPRWIQYLITFKVRITSTTWLRLNFLWFTKFEKCLSFLITHVRINWSTYTYENLLPHVISPCIHVVANDTVLLPKL